MDHCESEFEIDLQGMDERELRLQVPLSGIQGRLDAWLATHCEEFSRTRIQRLIKEGRITIAGRVVKASATAEAGDVVTIVIPALLPAIPQPEDIPLDVLYEDSDCIVLNKPPGLVVHPAPGHASGTLVNALLFHCKNLAGVGGVLRAGIVHRLDKDTSGVMVAVKNDVAMAGFVKLFQSGGIRKEYLAIVHGRPLKDVGTLGGLIGRDPANRKKMAIVQVNGKDALTHYKVEKLMESTTLVHCQIETGRTHQIRVHMKSIGCPIIGDSIYGQRSADKKLPHWPGRQMLHARLLAFKHPVSNIELSFEAPLPEDFKSFLV
ncbi:MAG: RluA family pseudouridine synthase [Kiritimatiellia bacterium]